MTLAKALGGGLPIGALVTGARLADVLRARRPRLDLRRRPGAVRGRRWRVLDVIDDERLLARVRELGERLRHALAELPGVVEVRGRGLMLAFELDPDYRPGAADIVVRALLEQRLVLNATGPTTVRLLPPLIIDAGAGRRRGRPPARRPH